MLYEYQEDRISKKVALCMNFVRKTHFEMIKIILAQKKPLTVPTTSQWKPRSKLKNRNSSVHEGST